MANNYFIPKITKREIQLEEWRPVVGAERLYAVSNLGRIRRDGISRSGFSFQGRILKASPQRKKKKDQIQNGYLLVTIYAQDAAKTPYVHILVARAFLGAKPAKHETNHKDGNKWNNRLSNLEYLSKKDHVKHTTDNNLHAMGERNGQAKATSEMVKDIRGSYRPKIITALSLVQKHGITLNTVWPIIKRRTWKHLP